MRQRFGELPRETQKTINNICTRTRASGGCEQEMSMFLRCIKRNDWDVEACPEQRDALVKCSNSSSAKVRLVAGAALVFLLYVLPL